VSYAATNRRIETTFFSNVSTVQKLCKLQLTNSHLNCNFPLANTWDWLASKCKACTSKKKVLSQVLTSFIYGLWCERNARIHAGKQSIAQLLVKTIMQHVRNRIVSIVKEEDQQHILSYIQN